LLEGVRVLDFGRFIAAPYCAMMLADFGADVIRIERRAGGEDRAVGPVTDSGEGGLFLNLNRNKRGMTLDLGNAESGAIVERLVRSADVVIVNLPIGAMRKLGLDYASLCKAREDIILVMASAFGPTGPYANRLGFDGIAQAMSGAMGLTGFPEAPVRSIVPWADYGTALHAAFGAMAALFHRARTGRGQLIDVSLLSTSIMLMLPLLAEQAAKDTRRQRQGNTSYWAAPSDAYRTRDGWIMVPTVGGYMFRRWARLMQREDLLDEAPLQDDLGRGDNYAVINDVMNAWCAERTTAQAVAQLEAAKIPCGPVNELADVLVDPQVQARELLHQMSWAEGQPPVPIVNPAVRLSETPGDVRGRAPKLGEHTDDILAELGFSGADVAGFRARGVV
jgi:crotonobetainyl-CoA:carnitine CoA-transferase CaiB-like acyl-CoA transferase